jgi:hypothetical protein
MALWQRRGGWREAVDAWRLCCVFLAAVGTDAAISGKRARSVRF